MSIDQTASSTESEVFLQELHDALLHLRDLPIRRSHPVGRYLDHGRAINTTVLQRLLVDAIEALHPPAHVGVDSARSRRYRYLKLRYVEGARLEDVTAQLGISARQARREHHLALQELAAVLVRERLSIHRPDPDDSAPLDANPNVRAPGDDAQSGRKPVAQSELEVELEGVETAPPIELLDVQAAVEDALDLVSRLAANRSVVVEYARSEPLPPVVATRTALRQILLSLLSYFINADSVGSVRITASQTHAGVELHFVPARSKSVSTAVGQIESPSCLTPPLEAASRLAEGQEGSILIEDVSGGPPAVHLHLLTAQATLALVVDDNPSLVRLFRRYVRGAGIRLAQARNGIRALQLARALQPDLILLDLMMPVQDGWDLFRSLQGDPATASIPIVACSILPERELTLSLGARDFLAKPVTPESLLKALEPYRRSS